MKRNILSALCLLCSATLFAKAKTVISETYSAEGITDFTSKLRYENLSVSEYSGAEISVEITTTVPKFKPQVIIDDGVFSIISKDKRNSIINEHCTVKVQVPEGFSVKNFRLETSSGDVSCDKLLAGEEILISASSGNTSIKEAAAKSIKMEASSGDFNCSNFSAEGKISVETSSGNQTFMNITAKEISMTASSGDLKCQALAANLLKCKTSSGIMNFSDSRAGSIKTESSSGNQTFILEDALQADSSFNASSGNITVGIPNFSTFNLEMETSSGDFKDKIFDSIIEAKKIKMPYNGGGINIRIKTSSGNITLGK